MALFAAIVGGVGMVNIKTIDNADTRLYEKITIPLDQIGELSSAFHRMRCNEAEMLFADNQEQLSLKTAVIHEVHEENPRKPSWYPEKAFNLSG